MESTSFILDEEDDDVLETVDEDFGNLEIDRNLISCPKFAEILEFIDLKDRQKKLHIYDAFGLIDIDLFEILSKKEEFMKNVLEHSLEIKPNLTMKEFLEIFRNKPVVLKDIYNRIVDAQNIIMDQFNNNNNAASNNIGFIRALSNSISRLGKKFGLFNGEPIYNTDSGLEDDTVFTSTYNNTSDLDENSKDSNNRNALIVYKKNDEKDTEMKSKLIKLFKDQLLNKSIELHDLCTDFDKCLDKNSIETFNHVIILYDAELCDVFDEDKEAVTEEAKKYRKVGREMYKTYIHNLHKHKLHAFKINSSDKIEYNWIKNCLVSETSEPNDVENFVASLDC